MGKTFRVIATFLILTAALATGARASRQAADGFKFPDTPAGRRAAAYFKAFNTGEVEAMRRFSEENMAPSALQGRPTEERLQTYRNIYGELGALEPRRLLAATDHAVAVVARARGEFVSLYFQFEATPPHKLLSLRVEAGDEDAPAEPAGPPGTEAEVIASLDEYLKGLAARDEFSGAVLVAKDGKVLFQQAYGLASKEYNVPNRPDTKFNLGSINKEFTQVAIAQLIEQGKLSPDDPIGKHLPDYPNKQAAEKATVRHLLNHSSGIGDFFGAKYEALPKDRLRKNGDYLPLFAADPLLFEPGAQRRYSNGGYIVLGAIIEKVSGRDYYDYVRASIFAPAGMTDTDSYMADDAVPNLATGYTRREGREDRTDGPRRKNVYTKPARGSAAGGGYSTVGDMLKFVVALQHARFLSPAYTRWILSRFSGPPPAKDAVRLPPGGKAVTSGGMAIAGGAPGINAAVEADFGRGYVVIVMGNYDPPNAGRVGRQIRERLAQAKP